MTKNLLFLTASAVALLALGGLVFAEDEAGYTELFNGTDLTGWKISENPESFRVENGELVAHGERAHLFYVGPLNGADFTDFAAKLRVMTKPGANAGFYFHTVYQEEGWPDQGHEAQLNATHKDPKKTGSLYGVVNVMDIAPHQDGEWFDYEIVVRGQTVTIKVNGVTTVEYTEPEGEPVDPKRPGRRLSQGTIAIQCHDPESEVRFKSIQIKPL